MRILGLIPARGGSKGIPRKNLRPLLGKSLVERAHESAVASQALDRVILSTDDEEIREQALRHGLEAPFLRPAEIAGDRSPMIDVALHALDWLAAAGAEFDALMLLQPTSPLRRPEHIRQAVALLPEHDAVCTIAPLPLHQCPHYVVKIGDDGLMQYFLPDAARYTRRQDVPQAYWRDGTIYLTRTEVLRRVRNFYGERCAPLVLPADEIVTIDEPADWELAERALTRRG
jgi:CMP-N-acetylneuraminic acid synthetase